MITADFNTWFRSRYDEFRDHAKDNSEIVEFEIQLLTKKINAWSGAYYIDSLPEITDNQFDSALKLLERWEKLYPRFRSSKSPTVILTPTIEGFIKRKHPEPMLSIQNAFVEKDILRFLKRKKVTDQQNSQLYIVEPKIDGVSIELRYAKGVLTHAVTRGDGDYGHDVTANFWDTFEIPKKINFSHEIFVRGELYIEKQIIKTCQLELHNKLTKLSQRNITSGLIQRKKNDEKQSYSYFYTKYLKSKIKFYPYYIVDSRSFKIESQDQIYDFLENIGFDVPKYHKCVQTLAEIKKYYSDILKLDCKFEMDGIVLKVNRFSEYTNFGETHKFHKWMIAWKFVEAVGTSWIKSFDVTVGRTGRITYVGNITPVLIDNTVISRVMMNSISHIRRHHYFINSKIKIKKAGGIIPKIISVDNSHSNNLLPIEKKRECPSCEWTLYDDYKKSPFSESWTPYLQKCLNWKCPKVNIDKIVYFCSREGVNIQSISHQKIRLLYESNVVRSVIDLYKLARQPYLLAKLLKSHPLAKKFVNELDHSTQITSFAQILQAAGINMIGRETWELLIQKFGSWRNIKILSHLDLEIALSKTYLNTRGDLLVNKKAQLVYDFLCNRDLVLFIDELLTYFPKLGGGVKNPKTQILDKQLIAITGRYSDYSRHDLVAIIKNNGGQYSSTVTHKTSYLISDGHTLGQKQRNAFKFGIQSITLVDFLESLKKD